MVQPVTRGIDPPGVNDLVRVTLGAIDDPDEVRFASEVPSRIEDTSTDKRTGRPLAYLIAAPWFSGDLEEPVPDTECALQWVTPRGLCMIPASFKAAESTASGLRVWRVRVTGPVRREERRQFVRVPWQVPVQVKVHKDLGTLAHQARERAERNGIRLLLPGLPDSIMAEAINFSEGGLRCLSPKPELPQGLPLVVRFTLDNRCFETAASVVWSMLRSEGSAERIVETALAFDDPSQHGEALRPLMFAAQLRARRAGLA